VRRRYNIPTNPRSRVIRPKTAFEKLRAGVREIVSLVRVDLPRTTETESPAKSIHTLPTEPRPEPRSVYPRPPVPTPSPAPVDVYLDFDAQVNALASQPVDPSVWQDGES
jgi:hypothetical protein